MKRPLTVMKTDGNGNEFEVPNPDLYTYEDTGHIRKLRHKPTNFTPKKKKRKK
jgi:hypothetical protein